jgi:hypothetical protein
MPVGGIAALESTLTSSLSVAQAGTGRSPPNVELCRDRSDEPSAEPYGILGIIGQMVLWQCPAQKYPDKKPPPR